MAQLRSASAASPKHKWSFHSKTVVVTGAAGGMGARCAHRLLEAGANVIAHDLDEEGLRAAASDGLQFCDIVAGDLRDARAAERLLAAAERHGGPDALIHAAGVMETQPFLELSTDAWRTMLDVNLTASFSLLRSLGGAMLARSTGAVVLFSSVAGRGGRPLAAHYAASKAGLLSLTKSAAAALGPSVRVNAVCPGVILTRMWDEIIRQRDEQFGEGAGRDYLDQVLEKTCLRRAGGLDEIADVALFLISDASSYVTGQALNVDGGLEMN